MNINTTINTSLQNALLNYFNTLSEIGYVEYPNVYKLITLDFINNIIKSKLAKYGFPTTISDEDLRILTTTFFNLVNSTFLIPVPINNSGSIETPNTYYLDLTYLYKYIDTQDSVLHSDIVNLGETLNSKIDNQYATLHKEVTDLSTELVEKIETADTTLNNKITTNSNSITEINNAITTINNTLTSLDNVDKLIVEALVALTERVKSLERII